jgi:hypothetical protein
MDALEEVKILYDAQQIAKHVTRMLLSAAQYPEFGIGGVPMTTAVEVYGKDATWVRQGIEDGWLPIGHMTQNGSKRNFYISPKKLWEDTGYVWKG